jgi:oxygen-dependent protoporphyrinogen oxidase
VKRRPGEDQATRQRRIYAFMNDRTFAEFVGDLPPDAEALFTPTVTRSSADIDQISAGAGVGYFSLVWNIGGGLSQSIVGGPSTLTEGIASALGEKVRLDAPVHEVVQRDGFVEVRYRQDGADRTELARCVVMATPATVTHRVAVDLDADIREALSQVVYGPYVSAAFLTDETEPQAWDGAYAIATPKRSFNVVLNHSNVVRGSETERQPGSSLMTFSPARLARQLLEQDDVDILKTYLADLDEVLPGIADTVVEAQVQRWLTGAPYCFPGRGRLQGALTRRSGPVVLAGDYLGTFYTETAISTGMSAAQEVQSLLGSQRQRGGQVRGSASTERSP